MIVLGGLVSGVLVGFGLVFLIAPLGSLCGRRWSDYLGSGRRAADRAPPLATVANNNPARRSNDRSPTNVSQERRSTDKPITTPDKSVKNGKSAGQAASNQPGAPAAATTSSGVGVVTEAIPTKDQKTNR
jgi:hypothetical protein